MPRPMKFRGLKAPKEVRIKLPGLGLTRDVLRVSLETRDRDLIVARQAMFKDLHQRGLGALIRARHESRVTTEALHRAYKAGPAALAALERELAGSLLAPLVAQWKRAYRGRDRDRTFRRVERFVAAHGGTGATTAVLTAANVEQHLASLTNEQGRRNRKHVAPERRTRVAGADVAPARPARPASNATKNRHRGTLSNLCTWLVKHNHLAVHPIAHKRVEKYEEPDARMPAPFTPDDHRGYLATVHAAPEYGDELAVAALLLLHTAADLGEVLTRTAQHVELERPVPRMRFKRTKTRTRERTVPLPAPVVVALRGLMAHRARQQTGSEWPLFQVTEKEIRAAHETAAAAIGRPTLRIKDLRHIAIIAWAKAGIRIDRIADLAGHTRLDQTRDYARFLPDSVEEADIAAGSWAQLAGPDGVTPITAKRVS